MYGSTSSYHGGGIVFISPVPFSEIPRLELNSLNTEIIFQSHNHANKSEEYALSYRYTPPPPLPPSNLKAKRTEGAVTLSWSPCIRGAGASEIECDSIIAGEDEMLDSLEFVITCPSGSFMTKSSTFTINTSKNQGYTVVAKSGIYTSQNAYIYL